jgi:hypothetical protein
VDGVNWSPVAEFKSDQYLSDLHARANRIYAVGTGAATADVGGSSNSLVVGWSDDGAKSWKTTVLPLDLAAIRSKTKGLYVTGAHLAAGNKGIVAVAGVSAELDVPKVLPAGVTAPNGWAITATGVDLLGPPKTDNPCPAGSQPAEKFKMAQAAKSGDSTATTTPPPQSGLIGPTMCVAENPSAPNVAKGGPAKGPETRPITSVGTLSPQAVRGVTASYTWAQLGISGDLLRAVQGQAFAFRADDGSTNFKRVALPTTDPIGGALLVQATTSGFDLIGTTIGADKANPKVVVLHSPDGENWTNAAAPEGVDWITSIGEIDGQTIALGESQNGVVALLGSPAGGWSTTDLSGVSTDGEAHIVAADVGPLGAVVAVSEGHDKTSPTFHLLVSRDGKTWADHALNELAGTTVSGVTRVTVDGERATVGMALTGRDAAGHVRQAVLVGTPS